MVTFIYFIYIILRYVTLYYYIILYCTVLYCIVPHYKVIYYTVSYRTVLLLIQDYFFDIGSVFGDKQTDRQTVTCLRTLRKVVTSNICSIDVQSWPVCAINFLYAVHSVCGLLFISTVNKVDLVSTHTKHLTLGKQWKYRIFPRAPDLFPPQSLSNDKTSHTNSHSYSSTHQSTAMAFINIS